MLQNSAVIVERMGPDPLLWFEGKFEFRFVFRVDTDERAGECKASFFSISLPLLDHVEVHVPYI